MKKNPNIFYWGFIVSFLGSLPPGVINLAAMQISGKQGQGAAMIYALGSMLAEVVIVRIALTGMNWLTRSNRFFKILEWMTAVMLVVFAAVCFITADSMQDFPVILPEILLPAFLTGVFLSLINPLHIPFWLGWSTVLLNKGVLQPQAKQYNRYVVGIASGTIAGFTVFIFGGQFLLKAFHASQLIINIVVGAVLVVTAYMHIKRMILVPASVRHARLFKQS